MGDEWQGRTLDMNAFGRRIAARKAMLDLPDDSAHPELVGSDAEAIFNDATPATTAPRANARC